MIETNNSRHRPGHARLLAGLMLLGSGCLTEATVHPDKLPLGAWGGTDVSMTATNNGATLQYSCGSATIPAPLSLDGDGHFSWTGTMQRVGGAPPPDGQPEPARPATFTGVASLSRIVMQMTPTDAPQSERVFELLRGSPGVVYACP